ncbi:Uncharacterised protein [Mycoplasmopsis californica]|uniref:Uncharacterized protein n=1 Tax=Mycoplasmopsis equigenitalium TaxID=114883 RepID=A0ABY5J0Z9_9BACT|nr:hypothetical protein [Mycoplasmopsis equigenitalium]UUD36931.1 hypothetical protein NPA09_03465 [Mycoplasmopsis equigenitalium]VEU69774.1 Uncharacterised protein [Mycoplasmopsis californica]
MFDFTNYDFYISFAIIVSIICFSCFYNYIVLFNITHEQRQMPLPRENPVLYEANEITRKYKINSLFRQTNFTFLVPYNLKKSIIKFKKDVFVNNNLYNSTNAIFTTFAFISDKLKQKNFTYWFNKIFSYFNLVIWIIELVFLAMSWWEIGLAVIGFRLIAIIIKFFINLKNINKNIEITLKFLETSDENFNKKIKKVLSLKHLGILNDTFNWYSKNIFEFAVWFKEWGRNE